MKKIAMVFVALTGLFTTACQHDEQQISVSPEGQTSVRFELDASVVKYQADKTPLLRYSPAYQTNGFSVMAFKRIEGGTDYLFEKAIDLSNMNYAGNKLAGNDILPIGTYKFLSAYGVVQPGVLSIPSWTGEILGDNFRMNYNGSAALNELFLQNTDAEGLESYDLGLTSETNPTVTATLLRAVSRVDILFVKAKKEGSSYVELSYPEGLDVFGQKSIQTVELRYSGLNNSMSFFGKPVSGTPLDATIGISNVTDKITLGDASATLVGQEGYAGYDAVKPADLIRGAAHIFGNYVIPNADATATANLEIYIKPVAGEGRTITLSDKLPLERNKVTLVKIYVIDNGDDPNVFTTHVRFEVEIVLEWDGSNEVTGEIN